MRKLALDFLDWIAFRINIFPRPDYHPIPWLGLNTAKRGAGTETRFDVILEIVKEVGAKSCVDVGCNTGYFSISLAQAGLCVIGVEADQKYTQIMNYTLKHIGHKNVALLSMQVNLENVNLLPTSDSFIFLSVWHHIVKNEGIDRATQLLIKLWDKTGKVLFFETGEGEMPPSYNLPPMDPTPSYWIKQYLGSTLTNSEVRHLGCHRAFGPDGKQVHRNLFCCIKK